MALLPLYKQDYVLRSAKVDGGQPDDLSPLSQPTTAGAPDAKRRNARLAGSFWNGSGYRTRTAMENVVAGGAPPDASRRCPDAGHDSFAGLFPCCDRGSARHECQPGI